MLSALHPLLLWGLGAVAVPILIHLLLRQRPRPRPWAAMRWLLAAAQAAQRRYRLTNLLLLLLRCLILALIALALTRPGLAGFGGGDRLVVVLDQSASMGARGDDPGPLAQAKAAFSQAQPHWRRVTVVTVAGGAVNVLADGDPAAARRAISAAEAGELPGGLDDAAQNGAVDALLAAVGDGADAVLVSDFQQDDGARIVAALQPRCRQVARWAVGRPAGNALVTGIVHLGDLVPGQPGELVVAVAGTPAGATLAIDDGPALAVQATISTTAATTATTASSNGSLRVLLPPLAAGAHRLRLRLEDRGLAYDNALDLPVQVRGAVPALTVDDRVGWIDAAWRAAGTELESIRVSPTAVAGSLPGRKLVALRRPIADGAALADWVRAGGVLWAPLSVLANDPALRGLIAGINVGDAVSGGPLTTGSGEPGRSDDQEDVDAGMRLVAIDRLPRLGVPAGGDILLRAGKEPAVLTLSAGNGQVVVEAVDLGEVANFASIPTLPLWAVRSARRISALSDRTRLLTAGRPATIDATLSRGAASVRLGKGATILAAPGAWQLDTGDGRPRPVVLLPSPEEGRTDRAAPVGVAATLDAALPVRTGTDLALPLLIAALLVALAEGLLAAWAGRAYGR